MLYIIPDVFSGEKILIVVPRTQLVEQLSKDFITYHKGDKNMFESTFELIYSGQDKNPNASIIFSTWQSIYNNPPEFFDDFDVVLFDEAHMAKSACLTQVMEKCTNAKFKFGFTGTLTNQDEETDLDPYDSVIPDDEKDGTEPVYPKLKYCIVEVSPLIVVIPVDADGDHDNPEAVDEFAVST